MGGVRGGGCARERDKGEGGADRRGEPRHGLFSSTGNFDESSEFLQSSRLPGATLQTMIPSYGESGFSGESVSLWAVQVRGPEPSSEGPLMARQRNRELVRQSKMLRGPRGSPGWRREVEALTGTMTGRVSSADQRLLATSIP